MCTLSLLDALPISGARLRERLARGRALGRYCCSRARKPSRSEEHTSELQSRENLVCRLLLEKKKTLGVVCMAPMRTRVGLVSRPTGARGLARCATRAGTNALRLLATGRCFGLAELARVSSSV